MTTGTCTPAATPVPVTERENRADPMVELLESLADLRIEIARQRGEIGTPPANGDPRVPDALRRLAELERGLEQISFEAVAVHQLLQQAHLI